MTEKERQKHFHHGVIVKYDDTKSTTKKLKKGIKAAPPFLVCAAKTTSRTEITKSGESYEVAEQMIQLDIDGELRWMSAENFVRY